MRMCVRSTRSPENQISRCLPRASTRSIVLADECGRSSSTRVSRGKTESKRVTVRPASARLSVRAARKIVSPSGMWKSQIPNPKSKSKSPKVTVTHCGFGFLGFGSWDLTTRPASSSAIAFGLCAVGIDVASEIAQSAYRPS